MDATAVRHSASLALLLLMSASPQAQQSLSLSLSGSAEVPPVASKASGAGQIIVQPDRTISGNVRFAGMVATMAHIHEAGVGKNGPPIITLVKTTADTFSVPADTRLSEEQYDSFKSGRLYVNVHSATYPNGEIRAQLMSPDKIAIPLDHPYQ